MDNIGHFRLASICSSLKYTECLFYRGKELLMQCTISLVDAIVLDELICLIYFFHRQITASFALFRMDGNEDESLKILIIWDKRD
jgi:hypothetical protein